MPKNIEDVIIPERRRTIRDIPIPEGRRKVDVTKATNVFKEYSLHSNSTERKNRRTGSGKRKWIAVGIAALIIIFAALSFFNRATFAYVPRSTPISFNGDVYTARKSGGEFSYSVVKLSKEKDKEVKASGTTEVSRKASGRIIVYNTGSKAQKLRETTRFETADGKVYQVEDAITVPPGSIEAVVYAEKPGQEFNLGLSDFALPGLKGTSLSSTIYARSKTPMTGGFVGREGVVKSEDKIAAEAELHTLLRDELISEAKAQMPEGFVMFPSLTSVTFESLPTAASGSNAIVKVRGEFAGAMFKESELSKHLAESKIDLKEGEVVDIVPLESLQISFAASAPSDLVSLSEMNLSIKGDVQAIWRTDEIALKADLAGRHKRDISSTLNNYPTVISATATIKPFWKSTFPSDENDITIKKLPVK